MKSKKLLNFLLLTLLLNSFPTVANAANDKLGIRVTVLPEDIKIKSQPYAYNEKLWFISTKNEPISRTIWVQDQVNSSQHISLELIAAKNVNGKISPDEKKSSMLQDWISFSEKEFDLPARGQVKVRITLNVPSKYKNFSQDAYVQVRVGSNAAVGQTLKNTKAKIRMFLPVKFQYAVPLFVGIGDIKNLVSFQIQDINGYIDNLGKFLEVKVKNDGLSPVEPSGNVQLSFADFEAKSLGPFNFKVKQIRPNETGYLIARVPISTQPAKYKSLVQAQFGSFADAKIITKNLKFEPKSNFGLFNILVILVGFLFTLFFGRKYLITKRKRIGMIPLNSSNKLLIHQTLIVFFRKLISRLNRMQGKKGKASEDAILDSQIKEWLESLAKSPAKKSPAKKSPAKKSPAKKSPAKKSPAKKSPAKKSPAKKSPAKKSPKSRVL